MTQVPQPSKTPQLDEPKFGFIVKQGKVVLL